MRNTSGEIIFYLSGLNDTRTNKQIYFAFTFIVYILTIFVNFTLIMTILVDKILHEPMNLFLCNLCVNGIYGSAGFYPKILLDFLLEVHVISYNACLTQMFVVYSYVLCEFTNLTVMAYDRYVAICKPLEYHSIMTPRNVGKLLLMPWLLSFLQILIGNILTARLPLCGSNVDKLFCTNWEVVKLSCSDTTLNNIYGYLITFLHVVQAVLIIISYIHIVKTCVRSATEQSKFMETCVPHVITLMNFTLSVSFDVMYARFNSSSNLRILRHVLSVEYLVVPPLLNPLIYGMKLKQVRRSVWKQFKRKVSALQ